MDGDKKENKYRYTLYTQRGGTQIGRQLQIDGQLVRRVNRQTDE